MKFKFSILSVYIIFRVEHCYSTSLNSAEKSLTPGEKIKKLLHEQDKGNSTGYNVRKIKLSNEVILQLMHKGSRKEHGEEMLKLISEYSVGMNENTMDIVLRTNLKNRWNEFEEILKFGKPPFIEHECNVSSMRVRFGWKDGPVDYFNYIRKDARQAWDDFEKEFTKIRDMVSKMERGHGFITHQGVHSAHKFLTDLLITLILSYTSALTTVEEIKCLDNNITMLMDRAMTAEEVSMMQRFVTFYTGEMAGVVWQMVEPMQPAELWDVCRELHAHGKPRFIDWKFEPERYMRMFQWTFDDISYFSALRTDANTVWVQFEHEYKERKNRQHHTRYFTTDPGIEEVTLP